MRIAQVSPLFERVPPVAYGGTERVVAYLTEALIDLGHDVTLFASGDSRTRARLIAAAPRALRLDPGCSDPLAHHIRQLELVARHASSFDVIHFHTGFLHMPLSRRLPTPSLTTLHGRLDLPDLRGLMDDLRDVPLVSISDASASRLPFSTGVAPCIMGFRASCCRFTPHRRTTSSLSGGSRPEKRVDRAIEIARRAGVTLLIAAKIDRADRDYFAATVEPMLHDPGVRFVGEVDEAEKVRPARAGPRVAVSDRLARAVRHGRDRSVVLRNAGHRMEPRFNP